MSIREYISSGVLELYVMDELSPKERLEVTLNADKHPDIQTEIDLIEKTYQEMALKQSVLPNEKLWIDLQANVNKDQSSSSHNPKKWSFIAIAASVAFLIVSSISTMLFLRLEDSKSNYQSKLVENQELISEAGEKTKEKAQIEKQIAVLIHAQTRKIELLGLDISQNSSATIFWNAEKESIFLDPSGLPPVQSNQQFQLWAIVDGAPVSIGLIKNAITLNVMEFVPVASAFAITLEPKGGSQSPTLDQMYVMGAS